METALLKRSHEDYFLEQGWLLALGFYQGWVCVRVKHKQWANLKPYSLGEVSAVSNLSAYNELLDSEARRYLDPHNQALIYHTFWGVTPTRARIFVEYPPRDPLGNMQAIARSLTGAAGYIDGDISPFNGPFSLDTEIFTVSEKYPAVQVYNPLNDDMYNVMMSFSQRQYTYTIIKNPELIRAMLIGDRRVKKFTMGTAWPNATSIPKWLSDLVGVNLLDNSLKVMEEGSS